MESIIFDQINEYFNSILRDALKYPEIYYTTVNLDTKRITLEPSMENPKLIEMLKSDDLKTIPNMDKLRRKIESSILTGFKQIDNKVLNVNLYTFQDNRIVITYTYGEDPFTLNEIGILSRLAAEQDTEMLDNLCDLNENFKKACKDPAFWWKVLEIKYPQYSISKVTRNYKPREIVKGMDYFVNNLLGIEYPPKRVRGTRIIRGEMEREVTFFENLQSIINKFIKEYYETFKYLIYENLWRYDERLSEHIIQNISYIKKENVELLKYMMINDLIPKRQFYKLFLELLANNRTKDVINLVKEINNMLISQHKDKMLDYNALQNVLRLSIDETDQDDIELYNFYIDELGIQRNDELYLDHYVSSNVENVNIREYILAQLSDKVDKEFFKYIGKINYNR